MNTNALTIKKWCDENLTPIAWQRIVMKTLPVLREEGINLMDAEAPRADLFLNEKSVQAILKVAQELYQKEIPINTLV